MGLLRVRKKEEPYILIRTPIIHLPTICILFMDPICTDAHLLNIFMFIPFPFMDALDLRHCSTVSRRGTIRGVHNSAIAEGSIPGVIK